MTQGPTVSVILPVYNRLGHLRIAVQSVLTQTFPDWELIVIDDGSDQETKLFLQQLADSRVRVISLPHSGNPSAVRNAGIRGARGKFLAFLDSDDLWDPRKLEAQLAGMQARPDRRWSYTPVYRIDDNGNGVSDKGVKQWLPYEGDVVEALLRIDALFATPTVIAERTLVEEAGAFDEQQLFGEDYDLWLRLAMRSEVSAIPERLATVRVHADSYTRDQLGVCEGWVRLYGKISEQVQGKRLRSICLQRLAESSLLLAAIYGKRGENRAAARYFLNAAANGWSNPSWWMSCAKMSGRAVAHLHRRIERKLRN